MTQEEKQLLLKDICTRLPYGIKVRLEGKPRIVFGVQETLIIVRARSEKGGWNWDEYDIEEWNIKPYLRPMSSMTEEERNEFILISDTVLGLGDKKSTCILSLEQMDWLNKNMFDYRGLIPMGLALEAKEGMYAQT